MNATNLKALLAELQIPTGKIRDDGWMAICCPFAFHSGHKNKKDGRPSFHIRADVKKVTGYNCYGCGRSGNALELVTTLGGMRQKNYLQLLNKVILWEADIASNTQFDHAEELVRPTPISEGQISGIYPDAWTVPAARAYLQRRLISEATSALLGLKFSGQVGDEELAYNRIMFPVRDRKRKLYGFTGRTIGESRAKVQDMMGLKKEFFLLGAEHLQPGKPVLLVEGLFAFASLWEVGADVYGTPVASLGASLSKFQAEILLDLGSPVYAFYDNDATGKKGIYGAVSESGRVIPGIKDRLKGHPVLVPPWPINPETEKELTDPDQLLLETVKMMMDHATVLSS